MSPEMGEAPRLELRELSEIIEKYSSEVMAYKIAVYVNHEHDIKPKDDEFEEWARYNPRHDDAFVAGLLPGYLEARERLAQTLGLEGTEVIDPLVKAVRQKTEKPRRLVLSVPENATREFFALGVITMANLLGKSFYVYHEDKTQPPYEVKPGDRLEDIFPEKAN